LQAKGAAGRAAALLSQEVLDRSGIVSQVDASRCAGCLTCVRLCPFDVPKITEEGVAYIEPAQCQGCGLCASACPRKAIQTHHYEDDQLLAKLAALEGWPSNYRMAPEGAMACSLNLGGDAVDWFPRKE
jgi:heterodisulfide reductase subunit A-like polyferredoxin